MDEQINVDEIETDELESEDVETVPALNNDNEDTNIKSVRLPLARIKHIMKIDEDCQFVSSDAVFAVARATEMFIEALSKESYKLTENGKRKTVMKKDILQIVDQVPHLCFLDGTLN